MSRVNNQYRLPDSERKVALVIDELRSCGYECAPAWISASDCRDAACCNQVSSTPSFPFLFVVHCSVLLLINLTRGHLESLGSCTHASSINSSLLKISRCSSNLFC